MSFNGSFKVDNSLTISPSLTKEAFMKSSFYTGQNLSIFFWVRHPTEIYGHKFYFGLYFKNEFISQVELGCVDERFFDGILMDEKSVSLFHKQFVETYAPKQEYAWGKIKPFVSERDHTSSIIITYSEEYQKNILLAL